MQEMSPAADVGLLLFSVWMHVCLLVHSCPYLPPQRSPLSLEFKGHLAPSKASGGFQGNDGPGIFRQRRSFFLRCSSCEGGDSPARVPTSRSLSCRGAGFLSLSCEGSPWEWGEAALRKVDGSQHMCDTMESQCGGCLACVLIHFCVV